MNKLSISPDNINYSIGDADDKLSIGYGVSNNFRRKFFNSFKLVNLSWALSPTEYKTLRDFYTAFVISGGVPFLMDLYLDKEYIVEYECEFSTFSLQSVKGKLFNVSAVLRVKPKPYNVDSGSWITDSGLHFLSLQPTYGNYTLSGKIANLHTKIIRAPFDSSYYLLIGNKIQFNRYGKYFSFTGYFVLTSYDVSFNKLIISSDNSDYELREDNGYELREDGGYEFRDQIIIDFELREDGDYEFREDGFIELRETDIYYELREDSTYELREDGDPELR